MRRIRVAVVDDNDKMAERIISVLKADRQIDVVARGSDGVEAIDIIKKYEPDVVLLDIIMPKLDGLEVLAHVGKDVSIRKRPIFIMVSAIGMERITENAFELGASYYIMKPFENDVLLRKLHQAFSGQAMTGRVSQGVRRMEYEQENADGNLEEEVTRLLHNLGVPAHIKGYQFLRDAIIMSVENREVINSITKLMYPTIAIMNNTTPSRVERAIRHAIEVVWSKGKMNTIKELFGDNIETGRPRPSNGEFVALIADNLRLERKRL